MILRQGELKNQVEQADAANERDMPKLLRRNEIEEKKHVTSGLKKTRWALGIFMLGAAVGEVHTQPFIPSDRNFFWNPGMMSKGGIPSRATVCATLSPGVGDDSA